MSLVLGDEGVATFVAKLDGFGRRGGDELGARFEGSSLGVSRNVAGDVLGQADL